MGRFVYSHYVFYFSDAQIMVRQTRQSGNPKASSERQTGGFQFRKTGRESKFKKVTQIPAHLVFIYL
jgi:hypothetical protein